MNYIVASNFLKNKTMFLKISRNFKKTFSIFAFSLLIFSIAGVAFAASNDYVPLVSIPGFTPTTGSTLTGYLSGLYNFLISIVGILAMGVIIYGGMRYVVSAGNPAAMEDAKEAIWSAVYGLALALGSWLIINVVNPDILVLKNPGVGLPGGAYSYNQVNNNCVARPNGNGTTALPCQCLDGKPVTGNFGNTPTNLTLSITPTAVTVGGGTVTVTGKLTDQSTNAGIGGKTLSVMTVNTAQGASSIGPNCGWLGYLLAFLKLSTCTITTAADGSFSFTAGPATCQATEQWQMIFKGDPASSPAGSNIVALTATGGSACAHPPYYDTIPAAAFFDNNYICQQVCSDPSWVLSPTPPGYHCLGPSILASGTNVTMNPDGVSANMKVNGDVTLDGVTNSIFPNDAVKSGSTYDWTITGPTGTLTITNKQIAFLQKNTFGYLFSAAGTYNVELKITPSPASAPGVPGPVIADFTLYVSP